MQAHQTSITITNEKGRLSQSEIDRMVSEAEQYKDDALANKGKVESKNGLENYCITMRNTFQEEKLKEKFDGGVKENIEKAVQDALDWLDKNGLKNYCFTMRNTFQEEKLNDNFEGGVKENIEKAVQRVACLVEACQTSEVAQPSRRLTNKQLKGETAPLQEEL